MPILRASHKVYYFSHIPKCGGSSIEDYIEKISNKRLSFLDRQHYKNPIKALKYSTPQHILGVEVEKLFGMDFFDGYFAVVRNPYDRFKSAFIFQKFVSKKIPREWGINLFAEKLIDMKDNLWGKYDNHFIPQTNFFYPGAPYKIFKIENGLDNVKKYIDEIYNHQVDSNQMPHKMKQTMQIKHQVGDLNEESKKIIFEFYKSDFENFKY